jgi:hypothetical protein
LIPSPTWPPPCFSHNISSVHIKQVSRLNKCIKPSNEQCTEPGNKCKDATSYNHEPYPVQCQQAVVAVEVYTW